MATDQSAPPNTSSRPSTMVHDSIESRESARIPSPAVVQGVDANPHKTIFSVASDQAHAQLSRNSVQHVLTIEHGEGLRSKCIIHEQVICGHSPYMRQLSVQAEALREKYDKCDDLLERIESIAMREMTPEQYEERKCGAKLLPLIARLEDKYPLQEYQKGLNKAITTVVERQFTNRNILSSEKTPKSIKAFREMPGLKTRLAALNSEGALEVAEELCAHLQRTKAIEKQKAKTNVNKAWAQGRLLLRGASEKTVMSVVDWAYHTTLHFEDAEHLYDIWSLATRLNIRILAVECMDRLFQAASSSLYHALSDGILLRDLLGLSEKQDTQHSQPLSDDFVKTVFHHVLKDENPPPELTQLVVNAMAQGMDSELWAQLQDTLNQVIVRQLVGVMISSREINPEQSGVAGEHIKLEAHHAANESHVKDDQSASGTHACGLSVDLEL